MELHRPVMPAEALEHLVPERGGLYVDATLGPGGHTELILEASPEARVLGIDRDAEVIALAGQRLAGYGERFTAVHSDYRRIKEILRGEGIESVAGILADLGISSYQLDTTERGFSFRESSDVGGAAPLDMRMDRTQALTAADLVNDLSERELADLIFKYGEERAARRIARGIVAARAKSRIATTGQLAEIVIRAVHQKGHWRIHPATRTFQALRIAVNRELEGLDRFIADAVDLLEPEGRLVVIAFHSLEDRIIKQALRYQSGQCQCPPHQPVCACGAVRRVEILTRKAIQPGEEEIRSNPRSRSAKLRACRKLPE
ncbi:MAG: 16S rRNA (cytosine(1402)-N(4))-methyltransferase RsmH [Acidobacteriota bacterium]|nr:MAG: 16S rRNA (cytosine(1402)-N(4))-methyltransferase RsmH [Acidobacteriota bacterium]